MQAELDFPGTVYGVPRGTPMPTIMARQLSSTALIETTRSSITSVSAEPPYHQFVRART